MKYFLAVILGCVLVGCGGTSGSSKSNREGPDIEQVIEQHPSGASVNQLKTDYGKYVDYLYQGEREGAALTLVNIQEAYHFFMGHSSFGDLDPGFPREVWGLPFGDGGVSRSIDTDINCMWGGRAAITGELGESGVGNLEVQLEDCNVGDWVAIVLNGRGVAVLSDDERFTRIPTVFYDKVNIGSTPYSGSITVTGYSSASDGPDLSFENTTHVHALDVSTGMERLKSTVFYSVSGRHSAEGLVYFSDIGRIDITTMEELDDLISPRIGMLRFVGQGGESVTLELGSDELIELSLYEDGVLEPLWGYIIRGSDSFYRVDFSEVAWESYAEIGMPPFSDSPVQISQDITYGDAIEVGPGVYSDPDTEIEELMVSYEWSIGGVVLENETGAILPEGYNVGPSSSGFIQVKMRVSDGTHTTYGQRTNILFNPINN